MEDLIGLREACSQLPSPRPGKHLGIATLRQWCRDGKVAGAVRMGRHWFVPRAALAELMKGPPRTPPVIDLGRHSMDVLRRHGLDRYVN